MRTNLGLTVASVVVMLATGGVANAQLVTVKANYTVPMGMQPATANPSGTFSLPKTMDNWRVMVDYGTFDSGKFKVWNGPVEQSTGVVGNPFNGINGNWGPNGNQQLGGAPAGLYVRARLQKQVGMAWNDVADDFASCP